LLDDPMPTPLPYTTLFRSDERPRRDRGPNRVAVQLALELRDDEPDRFCRARRRRYEIARGRARTSIVLVRSVEQPLVARVGVNRSEEHTSELQSRGHLVCR